MPRRTHSPPRHGSSRAASLPELTKALRAIMRTTTICTLVAIHALLLIASPAHPQQTDDASLIDEIRACAAIQNDMERLAAFDRLAARLQPPTETPQKGKWSIDVDTSPIDDQEIVTLSLRAENQISGWPNKTYTPSLWLRFKEGNLDAFIVTGMQPRVERTSALATATIRFDKHQAEEIQLSKSTDGEALFWRNPEQLIEKLLLSDTLIFRFTPFKSKPVTTKFSLIGLESNIDPLLKASNWTPSTTSFNRILAAQYLREAFSRDFRSHVDDLTIKVEAEGNRWRPSYRDEGVIALSHDAVNKTREALSAFQGWTLRLEVYGTTMRATKDGRKPFTSHELANLVQKGVARSGAEANVQPLGDVDPEYYSQDRSDILRGTLRSTGEHFLIVVEGINY